MPTISVIIPTFNSSRFIREAIQSVFDQTFPALEIIVVDDGSTDGTASVLRKTSGPIPISYHYQLNQGAGVARNFGVSVAQGDWIAFLDADDVWYPDKLSAQIAATEANPTISFCYSAMDFMDEAGRPVPAPRAANQRSALFLNLPKALPSTVLLPKEVFVGSGGFNRSLRWTEDLELFIRLAKTAVIHFIPRSLVRYRRHTKQSTKNLRHRAEAWPVFHRLAWDMWRNDPQKQATLARKSAAVYGDVGKQYLRRGEYDEADKFFRMAFDLYPWSWANLRRWGLSHVPVLREVYSLLNRAR